MEAGQARGPHADMRAGADSYAQPQNSSPRQSSPAATGLANSAGAAAGVPPAPPHAGAFCASDDCGLRGRASLYEWPPVTLGRSKVLRSSLLAKQANGIRPCNLCMQPLKVGLQTHVALHTASP